MPSDREALPRPSSGADAVSRCWVITHPDFSHGAPNVTWDTASADFYREYGWTVVEFVPAVALGRSEQYGAGIERYLNDALHVLKADAPESARAYIEGALADLAALRGH